MTRKIAFEEHFATREQLDMSDLVIEKKYKIKDVCSEEPILGRELPFLRPVVRQAMVDTLLDIGAGRIKAMDEAGIDMQVLSLVSPGIQVFDSAMGTAMAINVNDQLAEAVKKYPRRFAGLASIAPQNPKAAAAELERAVKKLGLSGATINSHTKGEYLDNRKYWPILEMAEKLDVPLYIHPRIPANYKPYMDYPSIDTAVLGFSHEVSLHAVRIMASGALDEFPRLKIVLGHDGESIPYWLWRMDNMWGRGELAKRTKKLPSKYMKDNFYVDTSGMFWTPPLLCAYLGMGADNILFAVDYPMEDAKIAAKWIEEIPIADVDKEKICHGNAEKLLKM